MMLSPHHYSEYDDIILPNLMPGASMIRLKRGQAPGLTPARPLKDGTARWRWLPGPSVRARGFRGLYLLGAPGQAIDAAGWAGLGFAAPPPGCAALTLDGPPLDLAAAINAARALSAAALAQAAPAPAAPRPAPRARTTADMFDAFLTACAQGRVLKEQRGPGGRRDAISPHTLSTYRKGLALVRPLLGPDDPRDITRADLEAVFETLIITSGWHSSVRAQRSLSRAFNWLRRHDAGAAARLPSVDVYTQMRLGQPTGRLRMATPQEAQAMFDALARPAWMAAQLGIDARDAPPAAPGAAAAWLFALWTCQRVNDAVGVTDHQVSGGYLTLRQSKTGRPVHIPLLAPAREAIDLARATRAGLAARGVRLQGGPMGDYLFWDAQAARPYRQVTRANAPGVPGLEYFKRLNSHWVAARRLAAHMVPSLDGHGIDAFGEPNRPLTMADSRDTSVTRIFEATGTDNEARLAEIAAWHGSSVENLLKLLKHYLVINPAFADKAGAALERLALSSGFRV